MKWTEHQRQIFFGGETKPTNVDKANKALKSADIDRARTRRRIEDVNEARDLGMTLSEYYESM